MNISTYIKNIRVTIHGGAGFWSRLAVAKRAGLNNASVYQIESGKTKNPKPETLRKLAPALQVSYEELAVVAGIIPEPKDKNAILQMLTPEAIDALQDPIAFKAMIITHKNKPEIKKAIKTFLETMPNLSSVKRQAILALCK